jgi:polysaccharide pyruvyl transferase CsaB
MSEQTAANNVEGRNLVVITGYYGFDNLGDEAILEELISELSVLVEREQIVVLSNNPRKTTRLYNVRSVNRWNLSQFLDLMRSARVLISGGGGLFQDTTGIRSVVFYGMQIFLARSMGVKILIYAQGLGPLNQYLGKFLTKQAWKAAHLVSVRDQRSEQTTRSWGLNADLTADPVWLLKETPFAQVNDCLELIKSNQGSRPIIGISLRPSKNFSEEHIKLLPRILSCSLPSDAIFLMLALQKDSDYPLLQSLSQELHKLGRQSIMFEGDADTLPSQWLGLIKNVDLLIGMRFHALLMALKNGKPTVGIAYDPKVTSLITAFKQPIISLESKGADEKLWLDTISTAFQNRLELATLASSETEKMKEMSCGNAKNIAKILHLANS